MLGEASAPKSDPTHETRAGSSLAGARERNPPRRGVSGAPSTMPPTVLIVDDYADALELLDITLTLAGYRTIRACNGLEAVALARTHRPAAIIMDLFLPQVDGTEAARLVRSIPGLEDVPILGYTARCGRLEDDGAVFDRVLRKPCSPEVLVDTVAGLLCRDCPSA
jgi:CheY-like chemotaxis protein